jgi:hypothetical protein
MMSLEWSWEPCAHRESPQRLRPRRDDDCFVSSRWIFASSLTVTPRVPTHAPALPAALTLPRVRARACAIRVAVGHRSQRDVARASEHRNAIVHKSSTFILATFKLWTCISQLSKQEIQSTTNLLIRMARIIAAFAVLQLCAAQDAPVSHHAAQQLPLTPPFTTTTLTNFIPPFVTFHEFSLLCVPLHSCHPHPLPPFRDGVWAV